MSSEIKIVVDNTEIVKAAFKAQLKVALEKVGIAAEGYAKNACPVGTPESTGIPGYQGGTLRNSITHQVDGDSVYIGTNVEYGKYVELGTRRMEAKPYLKPAATNHAAEYAQIIKSTLS